MADAKGKSPISIQNAWKIAQFGLMVAGGVGIASVATGLPVAELGEAAMEMIA